MRPPRRVPVIALAWHCIRSFVIQHIYVDWGCHGLALSSHQLPPARPSPTVTAQTQLLSFESSALTWLKREIYTPVTPPPPSSFWPTQLLATDGSPTSADASWTTQILRSTKYKTNKVKRVVDASTIQLEKGGYVSLDAVRGAGGTYRLPDCMERSPSYRLKQLLPPGTAVRLIDLQDAIKNGGGSSQSLSSSSPSTPRVWIVRDKDEVIINQELVQSGFALVRRGSGSPPAVTNDLVRLENSAKEAGLGIFKSCSANTDGTTSDKTDGAVQTSNFVAEFEPLDYTTETRYGDDGGKSVVVSRRDAPALPPANPGDVKGCSDFNTYEEALGWYETYAPYYGDVAKLDRDGDGVPCPGLPHTAIAEKYRMKVPTKVKQQRLN